MIDIENLLTLTYEVWSIFFKKKLINLYFFINMIVHLSLCISQLIL